MDFFTLKIMYNCAQNSDSAYSRSYVNVENVRHKHKLNIYSVRHIFWSLKTLLVSFCQCPKSVLLPLVVRERLNISR